MTSPKAIEQAGAVAVRRDGADLDYLIVTARRDPEHWILPKGNVEPGESLAQAAVRELEEEGGVTGDLLGRVGSLAFVDRGQLLEVHYFLVHATEHVGSADRMLTFEDSRGLLAAARELAEDRLA